jgi:hypothetical protein
MHNMQIYPIDMQLVFDTSVTDVTEYGIISSTHQPFDETRVDATPVDTDSGFSVHRPDHSNKVLDQRPTRAQRKHSVILAPKRKGRRQHTPRFDRTPSELITSSPHTSSASSISSASRIIVLCVANLLRSLTSGRDTNLACTDITILSGGACSAG